jgi:hypothetical protein
MLCELKGSSVVWTWKCFSFPKVCPILFVILSQWWAILYINSLRPCVCASVYLSDTTVPCFNSSAELVAVRSVTTGRRGKWREKEKWRWMQRKYKMTVGWRAFEVLKPRSWEPGLETSRWGPETQVLRSKSWNLALRAWNPGLESQVLKPHVEVLKPRSW